MDSKITINFKTMSLKLGLHKDSLNFLSQGLRDSSRINKLFKLRYCMKPIDSIQEDTQEDHEKTFTCIKEKMRAKNTKSCASNRTKVKKLSLRRKQAGS